MFYQKLYFTVTVGILKYRIPTLFYSNYRNTVQKLANTEYRDIVRPPPLYTMSENTSKFLLSSPRHYSFFERDLSYQNEEDFVGIVIKGEAIIHYTTMSY